MKNNNQREPIAIAKEINQEESCPVGGCGTTKGMCPGIAMSLGLFVGLAVSALFQAPLLQIPVSIVVGAALLFGFYPTGGRWFGRNKH